VAGQQVMLKTSPPSVSRLSKAVVFNLGYVYIQGYAKTSYGVHKIGGKNYLIHILEVINLI
jgi:hypothetical protein